MVPSSSSVASSSSSSSLGKLCHSSSSSSFSNNNQNNITTHHKLSHRRGVMTTITSQHQQHNPYQKLCFLVPAFLLMATRWFLMGDPFDGSGSSSTMTTATTTRTPSSLRNQPRAAASPTTTTKTSTSTRTTMTTTLSPQICSHQLNHPPGGTVGGSLRAMTAFWETAGITCFDMDICTLQDGTLIVSHPQRLNNVIQEHAANWTTLIGASSASPLTFHDVTWPQLQQVLSPEQQESFPILDQQFLPHYAQLIQQHDSQSCYTKNNHDSSNQNQNNNNIHYHNQRFQGPFLNLDLKPARHLTTQRIQAVARRIQELKLHDNIAVCVSPVAQGEDDRVLNVLDEYNKNNDNNNNQIPLGLALRDIVPEDGNVTLTQQWFAQRPASARVLIPSFKFSETWFRQIRNGNVDHNGNAADNSNSLAHLPMAAWTINSMADYENAKKMNVSAVMANRPMELIAAMK